MKEEFVAIVENIRHKEIVPFLQSLTAAQKKELIPVIKELEKKFFGNWQAINWQQQSTERRHLILLLSAFVCHKQSDFEKFMMSVWILDPVKLEEVINWYCPDWFSAFVDKMQSRGMLFHSFSYDTAMSLVARGCFVPSKELIARMLPNYIYEHRDKKNHFVPEKLLKYPATLDEHVWMLFEVDSNINTAGSWFVYDPEKGKQSHAGWIIVFKEFTASGKLDRGRVLRESLHASNRNFNKTASGWFIGLFDEMEPSKAELLSLQQELFTVLGSPHSKPVNTALQCIKKIMTEPAFALAGFLDCVPVLLSSNAKNVVSNTLMVLDKLAAKHADSRVTICSAVMQVFIHADDDLQARAAKIIVANKDHLDDALKAELSAYSSTLLATARQLLGELLHDTSKGVGADLSADTVYVTRKGEGMPLPVVESIDDLVFMMSQALDNNQSWHIDVLPAALIRWLPQLKGEGVARLEPALQRALKLMKQEINSTQGWLDHLLATFVIDVCKFLIISRGKDAAALDGLIVATRRAWEQQPFLQRIVEKAMSPLPNWETDIGKAIYHTHKQLLIAGMEKIRSGDPLPLLCTPTHEPGWLDPVVLVERLSLYQQAGQWPDGTDVQVAISRCNLDDTSDAILLAEKLLKGELLNLCLFLFGKQAEPQEPFIHQEAWMAASLALPVKQQYEAFASFSYYGKDFRYYTGQFDWEVFNGPFTNTRYDSKLGKNVPFADTIKQIRVHLPERVHVGEAAGKYLKRLFSGLLSKAPATTAAELIYERYRLHDHYIWGLENDIRRLLMLVPNNPEPFLALLLKRFLDKPVFGGEPEKRIIIAAVQALHEIWRRPGNMAHVFVGVCMLCSDKTAASVAGEIWLEQVAAGSIDNELLGKAIGLQLCVEFVPVKRFTDLVSQQMMRVSAQHNQALAVLLEHVVVELPATPIKNLKKVLELYFEVLDVNRVTLSNVIIKSKLQAWKKTAALQKIAGQLISKS